MSIIYTKLQIRFWAKSKKFFLHPNLSIKWNYRELTVRESRKKKNCQLFISEAMTIKFLWWNQMSSCLRTSRDPHRQFSEKFDSRQRMESEVAGSSEYSPFLSSSPPLPKKVTYGTQGIRSFHLEQEGFFGRKYPMGYILIPMKWR